VRRQTDLVRTLHTQRSAAYARLSLAARASEDAVRACAIADAELINLGAALNREIKREAERLINE
jgi:hypothetical protein